MRKFTLVLLVMIMATAMAFAEAVSAEWTIEAEASATFGVNLDKATDGTGTVDGPTTGFALSNNIDLKVTFVEEQTKEWGEGEMYGWIEVEDFEVIIRADAAEGATPATGGYNGDITAKVFLGPAYIVIATAGNDVDIAGDVGLLVQETIIGQVTGIGFNNLSDADQGNSVALGFDVPDLMNVELVIASLGGVGGNVYGTTTDADDTWAGNIFNNYVGGIYTETSVADLTISVDAAMSLRTMMPTAGDYTDLESAGDAGDDAFIAIGVEYEMMLNDMMTAAPYFGIDLDNDATNEAMDFEVVAGANITWGADDLEVFGADNDDTEEGVGIEVGYAKDEVAAGSDTMLFVRLAAAEAGGDDGYFPVVGGAALVEYASIDGDSYADAISVWSFGLELSADLGELSPYFGLMTSDVEDVTGNKSGMTMQVGTDINIIPATTFTVEYSSGNLSKDGDGVYGADEYSYDAALGAASSKSGMFIIKTKVSY